MLSSITQLRQSKRLRHRGVALIGYGLIVALLSIAAMGATSTTGRYLADCVFPAISSALDGEGFTCQIAGPGVPGEPGDPDEEDDDVTIAFKPVYDVDPGAVATSLPATPEGFEGSLPASVSGPPGSSPQFSVDGGSWVTSGEVPADASVRLRAHAPAEHNERITITFEIGGTPTGWRVSSGAETGAPQWLADPDLPASYLTLDGYSVALKARADRGSSIAFYELVEGQIPVGMTYDREGSLLSGTPTETGIFSFVLAVEDDSGRRSEREFMLQSREAPPLASTIPPSRIEFTSDRTPEDAPTVPMAVFSRTGPGNVYASAVYLTFDETVLVDEIHWRTGNSLILQALIDDTWQEVHPLNYSSGSRTFPPHQMVASDRFRISGGRLLSFDFGTPNPWPQWVTPAGAVAIVNGTQQKIQLEGYSDSDWVSEVRFELAPDSHLPAGVTLSDSGLLEMSPDARVSEQFEFIARLYDDQGFYVERTFALLPNQPRASQVPPGRMTITGRLRDPAPNAAMALFNGRGSPRLYGPIDIIFDEIVLLDEIVWNMGNDISLSAKIDDTWRPVQTLSFPSGKRTFALHQMVASDHFRLGTGNVYSFNFGTPNPWPEWVTPEGSVAILNGTEQSVQLEGASDSDWVSELTFELAPGSSLPAGVSLSTTGLLTVSPSATVSEQVNFSARLYDDQEFYVERRFGLLPDVPLASSISPDDIEVSVGHYSQGDAVGPVYFTFDEPVLLDEITWRVGNSISLQALVDGNWQTVSPLGFPSGSRTFSTQGMVASDQFRIPHNSRIYSFGFGTPIPLSQ